MPINVQTINDRILAKLDAEGSERYLFNQDIKPSINEAMELIITMLNNAFAENKLSPESLRELVKVKVWQANSFSRVSYSSSDTGHSLWSILAVYPKPKTNKGLGGSPNPDKSKSIFRKDLSFVSSFQSAKRLTFEEWNSNRNNAFVAGNSLLTGSLAEYAYLDFADYTSTSYAANNGIFEIQIRPDIPNELVAIAYIKYPNQVNLITDVIEFPESLTGLFVDTALSVIAYKQGDGTSLAQLTNQNIQRLISLLK